MYCWRSCLGARVGTEGGIVKERMDGPETGREPGADGAPVAPPGCSATGPVSILGLHAALPRAHGLLLDALGRCGLGDDAFLVALVVVPLLDFTELRRLPDAHLRSECGLDGARWNHAIDELVRLGALRRSWPRSPSRRIPAFRLARCLRGDAAAGQGHGPPARPVRQPR
ncbi:protein of unknown function [Paraburkholderia kururiensis]